MALGKKTNTSRRRTQPVAAPYPHPSGAVAPAIPAEFIPRHVAIVMDGNGRWANQRGLPRIEGHKAGEPALLDVMAGAIELGIEYVSVYAFSTENWRRSPEEVRFLMGFNKDVLRRQRNQLDEWGVRVRWSGRRPKLWGSVIRELEEAEEFTAGNSTCTLTMCVNYGGRAEITDAVSAIAAEVAAGRIKPGAITERTIRKYLDEPDLPDVDLFLRSSGEQRLSNFLLWQSAYAEFVFMDTLWPDVDRRTLWAAVEEYARRDRRYGGAVDAAAPGNSTCTLTMCVNYGGRAEITDAVSAIAAEVAAGRLKPGAITERTIQKYLDEPDLPDVDLFLRSSGEQRLSNFMLWQSAYAEFVFMDTLWPDVDRRTLWAAVEEYAQRDRRYGGAVDAAVPGNTSVQSQD